MYDYDPDKDRKSKIAKEDPKELMKRFLEKGGKVQKLEPGYPTNVGSLDKSKKPAFTREEIKAGKGGHAPKPDYDTYKKGSYHDYDVGGDNPPKWEKHPSNDMAGKGNLRKQLFILIRTLYNRIIKEEKNYQFVELS